MSITSGLQGSGFSCCPSASAKLGQATVGPGRRTGLAQPCFKASPANLPVLTSERKAVIQREKGGYFRTMEQPHTANTYTPFHIYIV